MTLAYPQQVVKPLKIPVLRAYRSECEGQIDLTIWCRHCQTFHHHGGEGGHRGAHCIEDDSPYRVTGYILKPVTVRPDTWPARAPSETMRRRSVRARREAAA